MLGYEPYEFPQDYNSWRSLVHPDDIDLVEQQLKEHIERREGYAIETRMRTKSGDWAWILARGKVVECGTDGRPLRMVGTHKDITERKRAEEALREYEKVVEGSHDLIAVVDRSYRYRLANEAFIKYRDSRKEDLIGKPCAEILGEDAFGRAVKQHLDRAFLGETIQYEMKYTYPKLGERDLLVSYLPIKGPGEIDRVAAIIRDISQNKKFEEALRESEKRYRGLFETMPDGFASVGMDKRIVEANQSFRAMLGYSYGEICALTYEDVTVEKWREPEEAVIRGQVLTRGYSDPYEKEYVRKDGTIFPAEVRTHLLRDENGVAKGMWAFVRDVSERDRVQAALRESEEKFRLLFEESIDPILLLQDGKFIDCNEGAVKLLQCSSRKDLIGLSSVDVSPDKQPDGRLSSEKAQDLMETTLREGSNHFEWMRRTVTGKEFWVDVSHTVIPIHGTKIIYTVWRDIEERKRVEEALRESEAFNRRLFESNRTAIVVMDAETNRYLDCNPAAVAIYGYHARDDVIGKTPLDVSADLQYYGTPSREKALCYIKEANDNGFVAFEWLHRLPDGRCWDALVHMMPFESMGRRFLQFSLYDITQQKRIEEALRDSEDRYRRVVELSPSGILIHVDGHIEFANPSFAKMLGAEKPEELYGRNAFDFVHPDYLEQVADRVQTIRAGRQQTPLMEQKRVRLDGSVVDVEVMACSFNYKGHDAVMVVSQDITERKRAEEEIARLAAIVESSDDGIISKDLDGTIVTWNQGAELIYGYSAEEMVGRPIALLSPPGREDGVSKIMTLIREGGRIDHYETERIRKDGAKIYVSLTVSPIKDHKGCVIGASTVARDTTERRIAEEALQLAYGYNRSLIEASLDPLVTIDPEGRIIDVNIATEQVTGHCRDELIGTDFLGYFTDPQKARTGYRTAFNEGLVRDYPLEIRHREGRITPVLYNASVYRDDAGSVIGVFAAARDVTERKNLEAQLLQAQKMEAIGTLAGGVAHDFNNILAVIMAYANLIQMGIDKDDIHKPYVDQIVLSSEKAADLTQSLLAFSRKQKIEVKPCDVKTVVASAAKLLKRLLPEDVELRVETADDKAVAMLDVAQIDQLLMNLATNARDAMPNGGPLTIGTKTVALDETFKKIHGFGNQGRYVLLSVSDTGTGMDEKTMARIFDPFFTTKEAGKGTGLGLSSVYGIVKQHGGYIDVRSELRKGTTFEIYLPLAEQAVRKTTQPKVKLRGGTEMVLVIEDDADVRNMMKGILSDQGYTTLEAANGDDGIALFNEHMDEIRLVILDVIMPGKNGKVVLDEISRTDPQVKAIFVSGYTGDIVIEKGVRKDSLDFLQKPISVVKLLAKVREVLDR
ncbi:MAG: PAS domain S-box protein [Syntrophorhabdales bacterium]|jgi:PAS domain S-box-containing protein